MSDIVLRIDRFFIFGPLHTPSIFVRIFRNTCTMQQNMCVKFYIKFNFIRSCTDRPMCKTNHPRVQNQPKPCKKQLFQAKGQPSQEKQTNQAGTKVNKTRTKS